MCDPRPVCPHCRLPGGLCVCRQIEPWSVRQRILLLQHPKERGRTINTARLVPLVIRGSRLLVGASFAAEDLAGLLDPPVHVVFPGPGAAGPEVAESGTLLFLDGTWSTARKMLRTSPALAGLPRIALSPRLPSRYRVRRQPDAGCVCTLEAVALLLEATGQLAAAGALLRPFEHLVQSQLAFRGTSPRRAVR